MTQHVIERLEAESAIRRLIGRYADAVNRRDADAAGALFAADAEIAIADFPPLAGAEAIRAGLAETLARHAFLRMQCDAALIDIDGDSGQARIGVIEASLREVGGPLSLIFGFYEDSYCRDQHGWRFQTRRYSLQYRCLLDAAKAQLAERLGLQLVFGDQQSPAA